MKTKELVEGILYLNPSLEILFRAAQIISKERDWKPVEHNEIGFIHKFTNPKFIVIVETQIHVFMIGDPYLDEYGNNHGFHVYIIEGYNCKHTAIDRNKLIGEVKAITNQERFLPEGYMRRIVYLDCNNVFVFNKIDGRDNLFGKSTWTMGIDIYDTSVTTYITNADSILKECYKQIEEL